MYRGRTQVHENALQLRFVRVEVGIGIGIGLGFDSDTDSDRDPEVYRDLAVFSEQLSPAAANPGMSTALRSAGLLDVLSSTPAEPSVAHLGPMPVCAASLRNLVRQAG
jgi:hypothetical protein